MARVGNPSQMPKTKPPKPLKKKASRAWADAQIVRLVQQRNGGTPYSQCDAVTSQGRTPQACRLVMLQVKKRNHKYGPFWHLLSQEMKARALQDDEEEEADKKKSKRPVEKAERKILPKSPAQETPMAPQNLTPEETDAALALTSMPRQPAAMPPSRPAAIPVAIPAARSSDGIYQKMSFDNILHPEETDS